MSVMLLALSRPVLTRSCPSPGVVPLVGKFKVTEAPAWSDVNDRYELAGDDGKVLATISDSPSWPKVMTVYTPSGEKWASATQAQNGEISFYDCAEGIVARLKRPADGTKIQDRDGNNVAEVDEEKLEGSERVTIRAEAPLAGEAGEKLATIEGEASSGVAFEITVEIHGKVWHHTPQVLPAGGEDLLVAGRRLNKHEDKHEKDVSKNKHESKSEANSTSLNGNPAQDPLIVALFAVHTVGYSHYLPAGKLVMEIFLATLICLVLCACVACCVALKSRSAEEYVDEGFVTEEDYDSDQERSKVCAPGACCSRGPVSGGGYAGLPKEQWKPPKR